MLGLVDNNEFYIDFIVAHRGSLNHRKQLQFLVRWAGYDASDDTWEPYANLRHAIPLHAYLRAVKRIDRQTGDHGGTADHATTS